MQTGGLGVYETVTVPPGLYMLSLYEMNKDGHGWARYWRDYRLSVRPHPGLGPADLTGFDGRAGVGARAGDAVLGRGVEAVPGARAGDAGRGGGPRTTRGTPSCRR